MRLSRRSLSRVIPFMLLAIAGCAAQPTSPTTVPAAEAGVAPTASLRQSARGILAEMLTNSDATIRAHAVEAVKDAMGTGGRDVFLNALRDPSPMVRFAGEMAVGELRIIQAKPLLVPLITDVDPSVQVGAIFAMHRLGDTRYSAGLEKALESADKWTRSNACLALGRLGEKSAVNILRPMLKDRAVEVRLQAAEALWRLGDEEGLTYLVAASMSGNPAQQMVGVLALAGPRDHRVIEHVRAGLESTYTEVVLVTARALGMLGSDEAYDKALSATSSSEGRQRSLAALALGAIGKPEAADALGAMLKDVDPDVRVAAALAILQLR